MERRSDSRSPYRTERKASKLRISELNLERLEIVMMMALATLIFLF
jgi:hypothetical protein